MIGPEFFNYVKVLWLEGMEKSKAKKKTLNWWRRHNIDIVWKEDVLARKCFEQAWEELTSTEGRAYHAEKKL